MARDRDSRHPRGVPRPGPSTYEGRFPPPAEEDYTEWHLLAEQDMTTGRWTWHGSIKPFAMSPFSEWTPRGKVDS
jgi:hypothetical protein